jgi:hypothetical protein
MSKLSIGSFVTAVILLLMTMALWEPFADINPTINLIMIISDVISWGTFLGIRVGGKR